MHFTQFPINKFANQTNPTRFYKLPLISLPSLYIPLSLQQICWKIGTNVPPTTTTELSLRNRVSCCTNPENSRQTCTCRGRRRTKIAETLCRAKAQNYSSTHRGGQEKSFHQLCGSRAIYLDYIALSRLPVHSVVFSCPLPE